MGDMMESASGSVREISRSSAEYPPLLGEIPNPPRRLYAIGNPLQPAPYAAVVGTRRCTRYGFEVARFLARGLAQAGITVVSGMARGIDAAGHLGALDAGAPTLAVLGSGPDVCYPRANLHIYRKIAARGTIVSEYPPGTPALAYHFPERNRIISGMSLGVVVVEARVDGGAMITARLAGEHGRDVFAVPGPVHSPQSKGTHLLIREGCKLASSAEDIIDDLGFLNLRDPSPSATELTPDERKVLSLLEAEPRLLDLLASAARMPASSVAAVLALLELKGLVQRYSGGHFSLAVALQRTE